MSTNKMAALQESYFKRLDNNIDKLAEHFGVITASAQVYPHHIAIDQLSIPQLSYFDNLYFCC